MNSKLRNHVEILFAAAPKTSRAAEMKEELLANLTRSTRGFAWCASLGGDGRDYRFEKPGTDPAPGSALYGSDKNKMSGR